MDEIPVMMKIKDIVVKWEYYPRIGLDEDTVARYQELYEMGVPLPPILIQKKGRIPIDGLHRLEAQIRLGREEVAVVFEDIPESEIYLMSIRINNRHGRPFSGEDKHGQIRTLRFETTPPLTYEGISKEVLLSISRVGEICREIWKEMESEFNINGTIYTKIDGRSNLTPEENREIQDRLDAGERTSDVAADYPVGESRISQKRKIPRIKKSRPSRQNRPLPKKLTIYNLKRRFKKLNPHADPQEIDWNSTDSTLIYEEALRDMALNYPDNKWYLPEEGRYYHLENMPPEIHEKSISINLKLCWTNERKYAQVKGTIPKKILDYVRDRLHKSFEVEWPLTEEVLLGVERRPDRRVFPELSDEELSELDEKSQAQYHEPEDDDDEEEMKKYIDLIPEEAK